MTVELDHHIVHARDPERAAWTLAEVLGVAAPTRFGPFVQVTLDNGAALDFLGTDDPTYLVPNHYAFLVGEDDFDLILARVSAHGYEHYADPGRHEPGRINRHDGGRGVYWAGEDDHLYEIITRRYGSGP